MMRFRHVYFINKGINAIPPSSFTFKIAFWNGTAFILKPKERNTEH